MDKERDMLDVLVEQSRRRKTARILPSGTLTPQLIETVQADFKAFRARHGLALPEIARRMGENITEQTLAQFDWAHRSNTRDLAKRDEIARAINQFIEQFERAEAIPKPADFIETEVALRMLGVIQKAIELGGIGLVYADAGRGKTVTLKAASQIYRSSVLLRVRHSTRTAGGFTRQLAAALSVSMGSSYNMQDRIIKLLASTGRPIFIDEAHQLQIGALEVIRDVFDECGVPIILAGTMTVNQNLSDADTFSGQFNRRICVRYDITERLRSSNDPRPLHSVAEVRQIWESSKLRLTDDGARLLTDLANQTGLGGLGLVNQVLKFTASLHPDRPIDARVVRSVLKRMHGPAISGSYLDRSLRPRHAVASA